MIFIDNKRQYFQIHSFYIQRDVRPYKISLNSYNEASEFQIRYGDEIELLMDHAPKLRTMMARPATFVFEDTDQLKKHLEESLDKYFLKE